MRGSGSSGERRREPLATSWNRYAENLNVSLEALGRYRLRTALSTLGIVLGMAAVIAMLSVGEGARNDVLRQVEQLGLNNVIVRVRRRPGSASGGRRAVGGSAAGSGCRKQR